MNPLFAIIAYSGVAVMVLAASLRRDAKRRRSDMATAILFSAFLGYGLLTMPILVAHAPTTADATLMNADHVLGLDIFAFARLMRPLLPLFPVVDWAYLLLPAMIGLAWVLEQNRIFRMAVLLGGLCCFAGYIPFPAVGPAHVNWQTGVAAATSARNCMPSMHFTWGLMIAWNARNKLLKPLFGFYLIMVAVATIWLGEHYFVDLLAAIPYTMLMQYAATRICRLSDEAFNKTRFENYPARLCSWVAACRVPRIASALQARRSR